MSPPHTGHSSGNSSPTRAISFAHAIREVSWERGVGCVPQQSSLPAWACPPVAASRRLPTFPTARAVPVLPRLRDQIGEPIHELKRREFDDAANARLRADERGG